MTQKKQRPRIRTIPIPRRPFSSRFGWSSRRKLHRASFSVFSSSKVISAFGSTTKLCAWMPNQKSNASARACRSSRIASRSAKKIARVWSKPSKRRFVSEKANSMSRRFGKKKALNAQRPTFNVQQLLLTYRHVLITSSLSPPAGIARIAISTFVRQQPASLVSIIRWARVRNAAGSAAPLRLI